MIFKKQDNLRKWLCFTWFFFLPNFALHSISWINPLMTNIPAPYRNKSIDLQWKSIDWFLYDGERWSLMDYICVIFIRVNPFLSNHGVTILNRSNNSVFLYLKIYWNRCLWSHPRLGNLNETRNFSPPGFFLKILNSVFESINMGLDHKLFLQLFVIGFCLFCSRIGKR